MVYTASDGGWLPLGAKPSSTVTMKGAVSLLQRAVIEKCRGHAANSYVKYSASSSSLLTMQTIRWNNWFGLMQTSSPRTFTAFVTFAKDRTLFLLCRWISLNRFPSTAFMDPSPTDRVSSQLTATLATTPLARDARRGDARWNGWCRFNQVRNVAVSAWSRFWLDSRKSTCCSDVTQATPPKVSIASITWDATGIELTHFAIVDGDMPRPRVRPPDVFNFSENALVPALLSCRSICHTSTCQTVALWRTHGLWTCHILRVPCCLPGWASLAGTLELIVHNEGVQQRVDMVS